MVSSLILPSRLSAMLLAVCFVIIGTDTGAQDLEPRTYTNTPVGLNFLIAGYSYTTGGVATEPTIPLENASVQAHSLVFAYARALDVWGRSGKVDIVLPYAGLSGSAEFAGELREREISGFGDPRLRFSVNIYGAPSCL